MLTLMVETDDNTHGGDTFMIYTHGGDRHDNTHGGAR